MTKAEMLKKRSDLLQQIRAFFYQRNVIEVDTPLLSQAATPDVHLHSLKTQVQLPGQSEKQYYYLHTSPEYPMKRLLCEGCGDIFFLGKVFRDGDLSPRHQIEFTMLEWYRLDFSMHQLIEEVVEFINQVLKSPLPVEVMNFTQAFSKYAQLDDVLSASSKELQACLKAHQVPAIVGVGDEDVDLWQQLVLTEVIEPQLGRNKISVITHFPAKDAALARICEENPATAERFEVFVEGMELANGYHELAEGELYRERFNESLEQRKDAGLPEVPLDNNLIDVLTENAFPDCSGVALGVDRLFMLQQGFESIEAAIPFSTPKA